MSEPLFPPTLTYHVIDRYRLRVLPTAQKGISREAAETELRESASKSLFEVILSSGGALLGCCNPQGFRFLLLLSPCRARIDTCGQAWYWHEARASWRQTGYDPKRGKLCPPLPKPEQD